jgi:hypothetical protein
VSGNSKYILGTTQNYLLLLDVSFDGTTVFKKPMGDRKVRPTLPHPSQLSRCQSC